MANIAVWSIPPILSTQHRTTAVEWLSDYFLARRTSDPRDPRYTGGMFERLGGGGDRPEVADIFTAEDIVAVSTLSVDIPAAASLRILGADAAELGQLLGAIPTHVELVDAGDELIDVSSAADDLYRLLNRYRGLGQVRVSKLLARKRPDLIPVIDAEVQRVLGHDGRAGFSYWHTLRHYLRRENRALDTSLRKLRAEAHLEDISVLRVFDVLVWMSRKDTPPRS